MEVDEKTGCAMTDYGTTLRYFRPLTARLHTFDLHVCQDLFSIYFHSRLRQDRALLHAAAGGDGHHGGRREDRRPPHHSGGPA